MARAKAELPWVLRGVMAVTRALVMSRAEAWMSLTGWLKRKHCGGVVHYHASTIERYPSLPELMAAVYDRSPAMAVLEYVF
jgi:hypothetical protein